MVARALETLLANSIDYAGLFPPASLSMADAVRKYAAYLDDPARWALGRFVVPVARLREFEEEARGLLSRNSVWRLSVLAGADFSNDRRSIIEFNARHRDAAIIDTVEAKASSTQQVEDIARAFSDLLDVFVEIPVHVDPGELMRAIKQGHLKAKVRTGGVTADAFPSSRDLARFIHTCVLHEVEFKATAGLHHPIRSVYNFTYAPDSMQGTMYGYLNVFLAAAFLRDGCSTEVAIDILEEESRNAFQFDDDGIRWQSHRLDIAELDAARNGVVLSFGSCSFREPIDDLRRMGLLHSVDL